MKYLPGSPGEWWRLVQSVFRFYSSRKVPGWLKTTVVLVSVAYIIFPVDLLFDRIPLLGRLDDLSAVALLHLAVVVFARRAYALDEPERPAPPPVSLQEDPSVKTIDVPGQ